MLDIEVIPAKPKEEKQVRVAAYARVSVDKDASFHSLEAQTEYYQEYVSNHPGWVLAGIYSDNGISGTTINRPEFQRMLTDCRAGKIDLIVTKSVTRFARNTVVLLETVRELKALGIDCYFEKENMHSISPDGELLLTLLAMYAEEEARSASENQKWRVQKLFDQGKPAGGRTYGYRLVEGVYVIIPKEAVVVRRIFELFQSGMGYCKICKTLNEDGVPTPYGGTWAYSTVRGILANEKYKGDMLLQKTFSEDFRTKKARRNTGELRRVYVKNSHEAIVDREVFDSVQEEISRRGMLQKSRMEKRSIERINSTRLFTGLIVCGICGGKYQRKYTNSKKYDRPMWICQVYQRSGKSICNSQRIPESILIEKTCEVLGETELSKSLVAEKISRILVPGHNQLIYELRDGSIRYVAWEHKSRKLSWTDEKRQVAREKALKRARKEEKVHGTGN